MIRWILIALLLSGCEVEPQVTVNDVVDEVRMQWIEDRMCELEREMALLKGREIRDPCRDSV